jgi:hypothetical protein
LMCGGNNHKLHDLCVGVDVWKQQLISLFFFLWLCQCFKLFAMYGCVDMGKNQQRLCEWYDPKRRATWLRFMEWFFIYVILYIKKWIFMFLFNFIKIKYHFTILI